MRAVQRLAGTGCAALVVGLALWQAPLARAAADASTTVLVLDVSGSMADPARIPPDFPEAAKLKARQDSVGRLVELAHPGQKVPLSVIAGGLLGLRTSSRCAPNWTPTSSSTRWTRSRSASWRCSRRRRGRC